MPAKLKLYNAAKKLFFSRGIKDVSVEQIVEEAGVSKMSFYRSYGNKGEVALEILKKEIEESMVGYQAITYSDHPFLDKMAMFMTLKMEQADLVTSQFYMDVVGNVIPKLRDYYAEQQTAGLEHFKMMFKVAQENGDVRADLDITFVPLIADYLNKLSADKAYIKMMGGQKEMIKAVAGFFLYGIAPRQVELPSVVTE